MNIAGGRWSLGVILLTAAWFFLLFTVPSAPSQAAQSIQILSPIDASTVQTNEAVVVRAEYPEAEVGAEFAITIIAHNVKNGTESEIANYTTTMVRKPLWIEAVWDPSGLEIG